MKLRIAALAVFTAVSIAGAAPAFAASSLLTPDGVRYALVQDEASPQVRIARAEGEERATLVAPTTQDAAVETQAQLAYDNVTGSLYVLWVRENEGNAEIRFASLGADNQWSRPRMVAAGSSAYRNVQFVLSHSSDEGQVATLLHIAWWSVNGALRAPVYDLFGFENSEPASAEVANLDLLANLKSTVSTSELNFELDTVHPPLAMARNGEGVDVAFGSTTSTSLTRLSILPRKVGTDVRIWKPLGRNGSRTPRAGTFLMASTPVSGVIIEGRLALYSVSEDFRFVMLRADGTWSEPHSVRVDEDNTIDELIRDLRHTVQELMQHEASVNLEPVAAER